MKRITFESSVIAKQKGFTDPTNYFYTQSGKLVSRQLESGNEPMKFEPDDFYENFNTITRYEVSANKYEQVYSAPTHQQVVDWFREKHNLLLVADAYHSGYGYTINKERKKEIFMGGYYEALNKAIEEAFKLIPEL